MRAKGQLFKRVLVDRFSKWSKVVLNFFKSLVLSAPYSFLILWIEFKPKGSIIVLLDIVFYDMNFFFNLGKARIRVQISAAHSTEEIERCVEAFIDVGKKKGVI